MGESRDKKTDVTEEIHGTQHMDHGSWVMGRLNKETQFLKKAFTLSKIIPFSTF